MSVYEVAPWRRLNRVEVTLIVLMVIGCIFMCVTFSPAFPLALIVCAGGVMLVSDRPALAFALMLGTVLVQYYLVAEPLCVEVKSINIYPDDLVGMMFLGGFCWRLVRGKARNLGTLAFKILLVFMALQGISLLRGASVYGQTAFVQARNHFGLSAAVLYFGSFSYSREMLRRIMLVFVAYAGLHAVVALLRWADVIPALSHTLNYAGSYAGHRVINRGAAQCIFMASVGLAVMSINRMRTGVRSWMPFCAVAGAVIVGSVLIRSMWVAGLVAMLWLLVKFGAGRILRGVGVALLLVVVALIVVMLLSPKAVDRATWPVADAVTDVFRPHSNLFWRLEGWQMHMGRFSTTELLTGRPFGTSLERDLPGETSANPHNFYVECFLYMGPFGVLSLLALLSLVFVHLRRTRKRTDQHHVVNSCDMLEVILVFYAVFLMAWTATMLFGVFLGLAMALAAWKKQGLSHLRAETQSSESKP